MAFLNEKRKYVYYHAFAWILYAIYYWGINRLNNDMAWIEAVISTPFFALIAYTAYIRLRIVVERKKYLWNFLLWFCLYILYGGLAYLIIYKGAPAIGIQMYRADVPFSGLQFIQTMITLFSNYTLIGMAYFFVRRSIQKEVARRKEAEGHLLEMQRRQEAEAQKRRFEFNTLSAQMSIHNISNWVNRWMVQLHDDQKALADEMEKAHALTVYFMAAQKMGIEERVSLALELEYLQYYIDLFKGGGVGERYINLDFPKSTDGISLLPTTLIVLFENAVKHGKSRDEKRPIQMKLKVQDNLLSFNCRNSIADRPYLVSHGLGLANLKRRLELCYGHRATFRHGRRGEDYVVHLKIKLTSKSN